MLCAAGSLEATSWILLCIHYLGTPPLGTRPHRRPTRDPLTPTPRLDAPCDAIKAVMPAARQTCVRGGVHWTTRHREASSTHPPSTAPAWGGHETSCAYRPCPGPRAQLSGWCVLRRLLRQPCTHGIMLRSGLGCAAVTQAGDTRNGRQRRDGARTGLRNVHRYA